MTENSNLRRTKIIATLGPATDNEEVLRRLILAGMDVARLNFSHGEKCDHLRRAEMVRKIAADCGANVALLGDLQGPKIRIARFRNNAIQLTAGQRFTLDTALGPDAGDESTVGLDYRDLANDCKGDDLLLLDDGRIVLKVLRVTLGRIECVVQVGGTLSDNKGINRQGGGLSAPALTQKDHEDIRFAVELDLDYLAVSFPRCAEDMHQAREIMKEAGGDARLVAKIERAEAVADTETLDRIIAASDALMVARGDLGVEIGDAELIGVQKTIIERALKFNKVAITATQMMESMIHNPIPTRAEVMDVANAVLDGTDAVMLSAETAVGNHPVATVAAMSRILVGAERHPSAQFSINKLDQNNTRVDETIALSAMYAANHLSQVKAIISLTETGHTTLLISRINSHLPIFAFSPHTKSQRKVALYRGVSTIPFNVDLADHNQGNRQAVHELQHRNIVQPGDLVIITRGNTANTRDGTNTLCVVEVEALD